MPETAETMVGSMRDLIEVVRTADLTEVDLGWATAMIDQIVEKLRPSIVEGTRMQHTLYYDDYITDRGQIDLDTADERAKDGDLDPDEFFPYSPMVGRLNPISPPVNMWRAEGEFQGEVHGSAVFGAAFNGPPDSVHGGIVAATLDELLGVTALVNGLGAFTGTIQVVYRSPTPLGEKVDMRGWVVGSERRKVFLEAELRHGDTVCATCTATFIRSEVLSGNPAAG